MPKATKDLGDELHYEVGASLPSEELCVLRVQQSAERSHQ